MSISPSVSTFVAAPTIISYSPTTGSNAASKLTVTFLDASGSPQPFALAKIRTAFSTGSYSTFATGTADASGVFNKWFEAKSSTPLGIHHFNASGSISGSAYVGINQLVTVTVV